LHRAPPMHSAPGSIDTRDVVSVCRIGGVLNQGLLREMLGHFVTENERRIAGFAPALIVGNRQTIRNLAHAVRGSAALVGAGRLHDLARTVEMEADAGHIDDLGPSLDAIRLEFAAVKVALHDAHPEAGIE
jgi:HPt (histidine-containing phosphotransfer) domain-containing protein